MGFTLTQLGAKLDLDSANLSKIENGKRDFDEKRLIAFFRIGKLKKFYLNKSSKSNEITFFDAVKILRCNQLTKRANNPNDYYHLLETSKSKFENDTTVGDEPLKLPRGHSNADYIEKHLKDKSFKNCKIFTETEEDFISGVKYMLNQGTMVTKTAQINKTEFVKTTAPISMLNILRNHIRAVDIEQDSKHKKFQHREVILSGYIIK